MHRWERSSPPPTSLRTFATSAAAATCCSSETFSTRDTEEFDSRHWDIEVVYRLHRSSPHKTSIIKKLSIYDKLSTCGCCQWTRSLRFLSERRRRHSIGETIIAHNITQSTPIDMTTPIETFPSDAKAILTLIRKSIVEFYPSDRVPGRRSRGRRDIV